MNERTRRRAIVGGAIVLALLSIGAGVLIAASDEGDERATPSPSSSPSATEEPTPTAEPTQSPEPSEGEESPVLEDGRHFVWVTEAARLEDGSTTVTFDLAYFLTGEEGEQAAANHGDEFLNGYYIVNDNPRLRTLTLAEEVRVRYVPAGLCCELQPGNIDAWLESILETNQTDYDGKDVPWWLTVRDGEITRIEQQYLP
jgi:hypothetical protein